MGYSYDWGQDMLCQVRPESNSSTNARRDRRSKGTLVFDQFQLLNHPANIMSSALNKMRYL